MILAITSAATPAATPARTTIFATIFTDGFDYGTIAGASPTRHPRPRGARNSLPTFDETERDAAKQSEGNVQHSEREEVLQLAEHEHRDTANQNGEAKEA